MSFFDLTKDDTLSAHELFKFRVKRDSTIPSRGGQKDFEPDGSWLQSKAVDAFIQERALVLAEPRVEKLKSLVQGDWEPEKKLVNVEKTGKFWAHMGFTDKRRNWLYPEEALFLMETNSLEVHENGVPLSIQEAYGTFLDGEEGVNLEEYQVFAHLRRLGFVVLRHEEQPLLTNYEKQINLDKYISKKSLKERKSKFLKKKNGNRKEIGKLQDQMETPASNEDAASKDTALSDKGKAPENGRIPSVDAETCPSVANPRIEDSTVPSDSLHCENGQSLNSSGKRLRSDEEDSVSCRDSVKKTHLDSCVDECKDASETIRFYSDEWSDCLQQISRLHNGEAGTHPAVLQQTHWKGINLPNIAGKESLTLSCPGQKLLPLNVEPQEAIFDVEGYRIKHPSEALSRQAQKEADRDSRIRFLKFSFAEWTQQKPQVSATNWAEYRVKVAERMQEMATSTPVSHLWEGEVVPLVRPEDASSFNAILDKLSIIQTVENKDLSPKSAAEDTPDLKITYDVHLPDHRFRKSMPGRPAHRVIVARCTENPPGLCELQHLWHLYRDNVPLHWAVVDSGDIAFYVFNNLNNIESLV